MKRVWTSLLVLALVCTSGWAGAQGFERDLSATEEPANSGVIDQINGDAPIPTPAPQSGESSGLGFERDLSATEEPSGGGVIDQINGVAPIDTLAPVPTPVIVFQPEDTPEGLGFERGLPGGESGAAVFAPLSMAILPPEGYDLEEGAINALSDTQAEYVMTSTADESAGDYAVRVQYLDAFAGRSMEDLAHSDYPSLLFAASLPTGSRTFYLPTTDLGYPGLEINLDGASHLLLLMDGYLVDLSVYGSNWFGKAEEWQKDALQTLVSFGAEAATAAPVPEATASAQEEIRMELPLGTLVITPPEGYVLVDYTVDESYDIRLIHPASDTVYSFYAEESFAEIPTMRTEDLTGSLLDAVIESSVDDGSLRYEEGVEGPGGRSVLSLWDTEGYEAGWLAIENGWLFGADAINENTPLDLVEMELIMEVFRVE